MINKSLKELAQALAAKQISSVELSTLFLDRIERLNPDINAFVTVDREKTLAMARAADARIAAGTAGPLTGIPVAQKDIFCAEGWTTTCGSKMLANFVSPYDATVIRKMHSEAGMVSLGKTNMDEFAMGSSNETSFFGQVKNPWDRTRVPGGSSGGSAAAVAARLAPAATGTDTGGSIRQPAALCNLTGLKPTYGVVSRYGMIAYASSLDQGGPMARSAEDCALLLDAMAGSDERDSTSLDRPRENYARDLDKPLAGLKIGLPKEFFGASERSGCAPEVMQLVDAAIAEYRKLGAETVEVSLPNMQLSVPAYYVIAPAEASSNLSRYDGVRFGYRHMSGTLDNTYFDAGEGNDLSGQLPYVDLSSDEYSFGIFHRSYAGLDPKGRFGLFAEFELALSTGHSSFAYDPDHNEGGAPNRTYNDKTQVKLAFNPGAAVYIFPNVCATISFGLGGIQYTSITQKDADGNKIGSRKASNMRFRLNIAAINFGMTIHLWDKKKQ